MVLRRLSLEAKKKISGSEFLSQTKFVKITFISIIKKKKLNFGTEVSFGCPHPDLASEMIASPDPHPCLKPTFRNMFGPVLALFVRSDQLFLLVELNFCSVIE